MNDLSDAVEQLTQTVADLQRRVCALETSAPAAPPLLARPAPFTPALPLPAVVPVAQESGVFSVLGKAMLAIAGAYLLRGLAEPGRPLRLPVIALSIAYAFLWLVPAIRVPAKAWFASVTWGATSAIILIPMLWELTLRFHILPGAVTAAILSAFVVAASALAWKRHFAEVAWVAEAAASLTALTLAIATRDLVPFLFALLLIAIAGEIASARHRTLRVRPLVAAASDLALFALVWIYSSPASSRADYPSVAISLLLAFAPAFLLIYAASASVQTLFLRRGISVFEIAQTLIAALFTVWTILAFWPGHGPLVLGALCLMASAAGYAVAFAWFDRLHAQRNYHVYSTGSLALLLAGSFLSLPPGWLPLCLGFTAVLSILLGAYASRRTLQFHALALLAAAAFSSGLLAFVIRAMAGAFPPSAGWIVSFATACAVVSYVAVARPGEEPWPARVLRLLFAALAVASTVALLVWIFVRLTAPGAVPGAEHIAVLRTLASCAAALALAWCGARFERRELVWLAWTVLTLIAFKLLFEDLRHGHLGFTAASIFLYAVTILLVPRLLRSRSKAATLGPE